MEEVFFLEKKEEVGHSIRLSRSFSIYYDGVVVSLFEQSSMGNKINYFLLLMNKKYDLLKPQ